MSDEIEANKRRARDYFAAFATKDRAWLEANVAPDYVRRDTNLPFEVVGPEGVLKLGDLLLGAFSEIELDVQDAVAEGDKVLLRLQFRGVHSGAFGDHQATGRRFDVMVLDLFRMEDGMIAEQWPAIDNLGPAAADRHVAALSRRLGGPRRRPDAAPAGGVGAQPARRQAFGPVSWIELPRVSTATVTGMSSTRRR